MPELAPEVRDLLVHIDAMLERVNAAGPGGGGTFAQLRAAADVAVAEIFAAAGGVTRPAHREEEHRVPVEGGEILARSYAPAGSGPFPAFLHIHGGAWIMGSIDWPTFSSFSRELAGRVPCVVVDVDYGLAPEHQFPSAVEECYASLVWLAEHASELSVDPSRIAIGGESAGANLAAAVCLMSRDRGGPPITAQILESPAPDHAHVETYPSASEFATGYGLDTESLVLGRGLYYAKPHDALNPYASPMLADDLAGLPPAHIISAEFDPLRDGAEAYGRRLADSGVPTVVSRRSGHIHGASLLLWPRWEGARTWRDEVVSALSAALWDAVGVAGARA